jgi:hypothetical protein
MIPQVFLDGAGTKPHDFQGESLMNTPSDFNDWLG